MSQPDVQQLTTSEAPQKQRVCSVHGLVLHQAHSDVGEDVYVAPAGY